MEQFEGFIVKGIGGFYTVLTGDQTVVCRPRGRFRREGVSPLPGDRVRCLRLPDGSGRLEEILPRRNHFIRPPVSNIETIVIVVSQAIPRSDTYLIDRMTALAEHKQIGVLICVNKVDLDEAGELFHIYSDVGYQTLRLSAYTGQGVPELRAAIAGQVVAFTGNSGVGKSSLLNGLCPELALETDEVSLRGGRGRHTTRYVELIDMGAGTWAADTPGFSTFDTERMDLVRADELAPLFVEFRPYLRQCRYVGCHHIGVAGCAVDAALSRGDIRASRFESYRRLYESAKEIPSWESKNDERGKHRP